MRLIIQRVSEASVTIDGKIKSAIDLGLLILLGIEDTDTNDDIEWLSAKTTNLRIFNDENNVIVVAINSDLTVDEECNGDTREEVMPIGDYSLWYQLAVLEELEEGNYTVEYEADEL